MSAGVWECAVGVYREEFLDQCLVDSISRERVYSKKSRVTFTTAIAPVHININIILICSLCTKRPSALKKAKSTLTLILRGLVNVRAQNIRPN